MAYTTELDKVPPSQVDQVTQDFTDAGAVQVTKTAQPDGTFTIVATFADRPNPSPPPDPNQPGPAISLSWDDQSRRPWSVTLLASIQNAMPKLTLGNPNSFLNGYDNLTTDLQLKFWGELVVAIAKFESSWNPHDIFHEPPPLSIDSVGLLQLSYEDQSAYNLEPLSESQKSLEDPSINLRCGVTILAALIAKDRTVASSLSGRYRGGAVYWSTLRAGHKVDQILSITRRNLGL
jgi:Transglycosylase SLT domain